MRLSKGSRKRGAHDRVKFGKIGRGGSSQKQSEAVRRRRSDASQPYRFVLAKRPRRPFSLPICELSSPHAHTRKPPPRYPYTGPCTSNPEITVSLVIGLSRTGRSPSPKPAVTSVDTKLLSALCATAILFVLPGPTALDIVTLGVSHPCRAYLKEFTGPPLPASSAWLLSLAC
jgi:hypothetical protein